MNLETVDNIQISLLLIIGGILLQALHKLENLNKSLKSDAENDVQNQEIESSSRNIVKRYAIIILGITFIKLSHAFIMIKSPIELRGYTIFDIGIMLVSIMFIIAYQAPTPENQDES